MSQVEAFKARVEAYLTQQTAQTVIVTHAMPLAGGASRDSWAVTAHIGGQTERLVIRKDYPTQMNENALTRTQEFQLMRRAYESGVRMARVRWLCDDPDVLGLPFFIMDFVEGVSIGRRVMTLPELEDARRVLPQQMAEQLAAIHRMDVSDLTFLQCPPDHDPARAVINETYAVLDTLGVRSPAFEFALRWASERAPAPQRLTFVHGDFRIGNMLVTPQGLAAVIDWEFGHIGDPVEEIGYLCMRDWRFGNGRLRAAGLSDREQFISAYEQASGHTVDRSSADWWELVGNIRWGVICLAQAERHLSGKDPSVELASLGRRSAEMQFEALRIIEAIETKA